MAIVSPFSAFLIDIGGVTSATQIDEGPLTPEQKRSLLEDAIRAPVLDEKAIARCDATIAAYNQGLAPYIVFNGGPGAVTYFTPSGVQHVVGNLPRDAKVMHPDLMRDYVRNHRDGRHIPEDAMLDQRLSTDTIGSAVFVKPLLEERGWSNNYFVSNHFHIPRSLRIFNHVLGPRFVTSGLPAFTRMDEQQLYANEDPRIFFEGLGRVQQADDAAIERWLFVDHGIYNKIGEPELIKLLRHNTVDGIELARQTKSQ